MNPKVKKNETKKQKMKRSKIVISRGEIYAESVKPLFIAVGSWLSTQSLYKKNENTF